MKKTRGPYKKSDIEAALKATGGGVKCNGTELYFTQEPGDGNYIKGEYNDVSQHGFSSGAAISMHLNAQQREERTNSNITCYSRNKDGTFSIKTISVSEAFKERDKALAAKLRNKTSFQSANAPDISS